MFNVSPVSERVLSEKVVARRLRISPRTLQNWRWRGYGPPFLKIGKRVLYSESDLLAWQLEQRRETAAP
jgi:DNA-binding transcriptional MerR regulator